MDERISWNNLDMEKTTSPLRYPGGKQKLAGFIKHLISANKVSDGFYAEPYAGGCGLALDLLFSESIYHLRLNDADFNIYAFWRSVLEYPEELVDRVMNAKLSVSEWERQRIILQSSVTNILDKGFATFFLNRTNRSGILSAGPIGGKDQTGNWKIDARFNKENLVSRIRRVAMYANRIEIHNLDAMVFLEQIKIEASKQKALVYLDPPYYVRGPELYLNAYEHNDHASLAEFLESNYSDVKWIVSYDVCLPVANLYNGFRCSEQILNYSANTFRKGNEFVFYSNKMILPSDIVLRSPYAIISNSNIA